MTWKATPSRSYESKSYEPLTECPSTVCLEYHLCVTCLVLYESAFVDSVTGTLDVNNELKADQEYQENVSSFWLKVSFSMLDAETKNVHVHLKKSHKCNEVKNLILRKNSLTTWAEDKMLSLDKSCFALTLCGPLVQCSVQHWKWN